MTNLSQYQGLAQFGPAYAFSWGNDTHAPGSVDRVLAERMIRLCSETAPYLYRDYTPTAVEYTNGSRPELERYADEATAGCNSDEERVAGIAKFCAGLGEGLSDDLDSMRFGGTEEEIIQRGSDWCTDLARGGCVLCQVAGLPARNVILANTGEAHSGHGIIEVFRRKAWGAVDPTTDVIYLSPEGDPASTWDLMNHPDWIEAHWRDASTPYAKAGQFRAVALSNYFVRETAAYDYTVSGLNAYCRSTLEMSVQGWPGGLRWLHGKDRL